MDDGSQESEMSLDLTVNDLQTPRCGELSESIIKKKRKGNYFQGLSLRRQSWGEVGGSEIGEEEHIVQSKYRY